MYFVFGALVAFIFLLATMESAQERGTSNSDDAAAMLCIGISIAAIILILLSL